MQNLMRQMNRAAQKPTTLRSYPAIGTGVSGSGRLSRVWAMGYAHAMATSPRLASLMGMKL